MAHLEVGGRLATREIIETAKDVFFLEPVEVSDALANLDHHSLTDIARRRRAEQAWVAAHPGPAFLGDPPGLPPDIGAFPAVGRRLNQALPWTVEREFGIIVLPSGADGVVSGIPGAAGIYTGTARLVRSEADFANAHRGDVVICPITNPS